MDLLHKKCEVCGTNISKIKKNWYRLIFFNAIKCPTCGNKYVIPKWLHFIFSIPTGVTGLITLLFLLIVFILIIIDIEKIIGIKIDNVFILYGCSYVSSLILAFLIMLLVPLILFKANKDKEN